MDTLPPGGDDRGVRLGRYEVTGEIARGGAGVVYRGRLPGGGEVALKLLHLPLGGDPQRRARFGRELEALCRLDHPAIVRVLDHGEEQGRTWLALELVDGDSLEQRLQRGPVPAREAAELARTLADALAHAHRAGIAHRDLKPGNVLLGRDGLPRLTDLGLALDLDPTRTRLSQSGQLMGTPGFMAPEQAQGRLAEVGPPADVYGLGATLYALLTGVPPFQGGLAEVLVATSERPPVPPSQLVPGVDPALERLCLRCLAKRPEDRPTAAAVEAELGAWREGGSHGAPRRSAWLLLPPAAAALLALVTLAAPERASAPTASPPTSAPSPPPPSAPAPPPPARSPAAEAAPPGGPDVRAMDQAFLEALRQAGDPRVLSSSCEEALARDPRDAVAWLLRASTQVLFERPHDAIADARRATELAPGWARAWRMLGSFQAISVPGQGQEGLASLERGLELDPSDADGWRLHGWALATQGQREAARADLDRALELDPRLVHAWQLRGSLALQLDDLPAAVADLEQALARGGGGDTEALREEARRRLAASRAGPR